MNDLGLAGAARDDASLSAEPYFGRIEQGQENPRTPLGMVSILHHRLYAPSRTNVDFAIIMHACMHS